MSPWAKYPTIYEINTWVWLSEPITALTFWRSDLTYGTSGGSLQFTSMGNYTTFTARSVAEPASILLLAGGLPMLWRRRKA